MAELAEGHKNAPKSPFNICNLWRNYYVEVHMLVFWAAFNMHILAWFPSLYGTLCYNIYNSEKICSSLSENEEAENAVQTEAALWLEFMEIAKFIPNILSSLLLGKYGDLYGVKLPLLLATGSMCIQMFFIMTSVSSIGWPLYSLAISCFFTTFGGTTTVFVSSQFTEVARIVKDENVLTFRYAVLIAFWNGGVIISGNITTVLFDVLSYQSIMVLAQTILTITFVSILITYKTFDKSNEMSTTEKNSSSEIVKVVSADNEKGSELNKDPNTLHLFAEIYINAWQTLIKYRPNNKRMHLFIILIVGLIYATTDVGLDAIILLYVYRSPLSWRPQDYAYWNVALYATQIIGGVLAAYLLKRFNFHDLTVVLIGLASSIGKMIVISVATQSWIMYASLAIGTISTVGFSALRSFFALLGEKEETGSLMALQTMIMSWSVLFGAVVFNNIYSASLTFYPGLPFAFNSGLLFLCFLAMLFVRIDYGRRNKIISNENENVKPEMTRL